MVPTSLIIHNRFMPRILFFYIASCCLLFAACKKETEYNVTAVNDIISFTVTADGQQINAIVKDDSLLIYWPWPVMLPATITPDIVVATGISLSPASGTPVNFATGTAYRVTIAGKQKSYYLKIIKNWPDLDIRTRSNTARIAGGGKLTINGLNYLLPDISMSKLILISRKTGVRYETTPETITEFTLGVRIPKGVLPVDTSLDDGYWVLIENAGRTLELRNYIIYING